MLDRGRLVTETFERGALAGTDPARVPLTATHPTDAGTLPIGVTLELRRTRRRRLGRMAGHRDTALGDEVLEPGPRRRAARPVLGFAEVAGGSRWSRRPPARDPDPGRTRPRRRGPGARLRRRRGGGRPGRLRASYSHRCRPWPGSVGKHHISVGVGHAQAPLPRLPYLVRRPPGDRCPPLLPGQPGSSAAERKREAQAVTRTLLRPASTAATRYEASPDAVTARPSHEQAKRRRPPATYDGPLRPSAACRPSPTIA